MNKVKSIVHKKLGQFKAHGLAYCEDGNIFIDERLRGQRHLYVLVHEIIHIQNPTWSEIKVEGHSKEMSSLLWELGYRRISE